MIRLPRFVSSIICLSIVLGKVLGLLFTSVVWSRRGPSLLPLVFVHFSVSSRFSSSSTLRRSGPSELRETENVYLSLLTSGVQVDDSGAVDMALETLGRVVVFL